MKHALPPLLAVVVLGAPLGAWWGTAGTVVRERAETWSKEQYSANYQAWRDEARSTAGPAEMAGLLCLALLVFVCAYETLKFSLRRLLYGSARRPPNGPVAADRQR